MELIIFLLLEKTVFCSLDTKNFMFSMNLKTSKFMASSSTLLYVRNLVHMLYEYFPNFYLDTH